LQAIVEQLALLDRGFKRRTRGDAVAVAHREELELRHFVLQ
jgi:hypothetical protein